MRLAPFVSFMFEGERNNRVLQAHRITFEFFVGKIPGEGIKNESQSSACRCKLATRLRSSTEQFLSPGVDRIPLRSMPSTPKKLCW